MLPVTLLSLLFFLDWPQHLGPGRNGAYTGSDVKWPSTQAWKREVGEGFAGPAIADAKVILFHRRANREIVEAFQTSTGESVWAFSYETAYKDDFGFDKGPRSTPTVAGGRVYTFGAEGVLHAIDLATGKKIWRVNAHDMFKVKKGFFGAACSPLVEGGKVYINVGGNTIGVAAFDAEKGKLKWGATSHNISYSSPIMAKFGVVFFTREGIAIVSPEKGKLIYELPWRSRSHSSVNAATPIVDGDTLFISSGYGTGAIALDFSTTPPTRLWANDDSLSAHYATPVLKDGYLYGFHGLQQQGQEFRAVELRTGKVAWTMKSYGAGTVTLLNDELMLVREDGQVFRIKPDPKALVVLGNNKLMDGKIRAYPAIGNGLVCLRNTKELACFQ